LFNGNYKEYKEYQQQQIKAKQDKERNERLLLLETKIAEVISRLSLNPSEELDRQLENLLSEKEKLIQKNFD
jgi:pleuromutilin/lincosamide/streptogramin A transport system ATP-binding/permease protein